LLSSGGAGIPGFDDSELPRLLGILFGSCIVLNHVLSSPGGLISDAQLVHTSLSLALSLSLSSGHFGTLNPKPFNGSSTPFFSIETFSRF
jgi:hypothetical protein